MKTEFPTYWNTKRNKALLNFVEERIPIMGNCPKNQPALERFRKYSNGYYDLFNNGGCNWNVVGLGREFQSAMKHTRIGTLTKNVMMNLINGTGSCLKLELAGDELLLAAANEILEKEQSI